MSVDSIAHVTRLVIFQFLITSCVSYLIVLDNRDVVNEDVALLDTNLQFSNSYPRRYYLNIDRSASFVEKLIRVNAFDGSVSSRQRIECTGVKYPNLFTFYIDSISNGTFEYISVPLRVYIKGCFSPSRLRDSVEVEDYYSKKIGDNKQWYSETLVSYALPGTSVPTSDPSWETCFQKDQFVMSLGNYIIPQFVFSKCAIQYLDVNDARLSVRSVLGNLVAAQNFCIPLDPPWKVKVFILYDCSVNGTFNRLVSPATHHIKIVFWHRREVNEVGRVRRDIPNSGNTDNRMPQFEKALYTASVSEEQPPSVSVCTVHAKSTEGGGDIFYQMVPLLDGRSHSMFAMDSETGLITTSVALDREQLDVHYFRLQAVDLSYRPYSATSTLQINVLDINDHTPVFEATNGEYETTIRESVPIGSIVTTVRATDKDIGHNGEVEYSIQNVNGADSTGEYLEVFSLDSSSGVLITRLPLDRELTESYKIIVIATDRALPASERKSSSATVVIKVLDDNDNYPQFVERTYSVSVAEDANANISPVIATVRATDLDQGQNAAIRYAIISGNTQGQFSIDSQNGEVTLIKSLDYETMRSYRLLIRAQDGGSPSHSNTTQLLVNVKDVNDNVPRFYTSLFQESVLENVPVGFSIVRVQAYDADEGENAMLKYLIGDRDWQGSLSTDLPITVDEINGWVYTTRLLDREINSKYQFQILAQDKGIPAKTATASVIINVQDVNDNDPTFNPKNYETVVSESDPPGTPVTTLLATDPDENPRLHYEIANGNVRGRFAITVQNGRGLITIAQALDYKQEKRFALTVKAIDSGGRFDTANVYVNVSDANNFSPVFQNAPYSASVFEDVPVGTTVIIVTATDGDVEQNAQITYSLINGIGESSEFSINPQTGAITTAKTLDRETQSSYLLTVTAKDGGIPSLSDTTDVEISVTDVNDNSPQFSKSSYMASISEDALVGTSVLQISGTDVDNGLNGRIRYAMQSTVEAFIIDATSGVIRTAAVLDRESVSQYEIQALAIDRGTPPLSSSVLVSIKIEDVNDSPPAFESDKLIFYIAENSPIGSQVGELYARDPDEGQNAAVHYSIIDHQGGTNATYPIFYSFSYLEDVIIDIGSMFNIPMCNVLTMVEWPKSFNDKIRVLSGEDANSFSLVRRQGSDKAQLVSMIELDYESAKKKFDLVVRAASPPLRNDVHVEVLVTDMNDNAPHLKDFHVIFNNFKDCFPPGPLGKVPAFDADINDKLRYRILSGNNANLVYLNESTGQITLSPQLNTNVPKTALIEVSVSDGVNEVKAWMQLIVRLITDEMLLSSVTVRLNDMTQQAFLSPLFMYFVEALAAIIPCPKENVYLFSILDDTDVNMRILNISFSVRKPNESFYSSQYLKEKIYLNRMALAKLSTLQILPFDDNLCVGEPCLNFEHCSSVLKFGNASSFISSDTLLFRPIYPVSSFTCRCPFGFTGKQEHYLCDMEVNLCYSNPCVNGGTCHRKEGGYICSCLVRFTGDNCQIDLESSPCQPLVCHSGSTCTSLPQGGFICDDCTSNGLHHYDNICQLRARSFPKNSFLTFPSLKQRNRLHLMLKFATLEDSGLLLYNGRYNEQHDFISLEITDGGQSVQFSFSLGSDVTRVVASLPSGVNDGNWHTITVSFFNRSATISLDDCDTALTVRYGPQMGYLCANYSSHHLDARCAVLTETCYRFLDLTGPLQIGGLPSFATSTAFQVQNKDFIGCISDIYIDYQLLDLNSFVADNGTSIGCPEKQAYCTDEPCQNGGTCSNSWATYYCECSEGWSGKDCSQPTGMAWRFNGDGMLVFNPLLRSVQLPWAVSFSVRTLQHNAFIMSIQLGQNSTAVVELESGFVVYVLDGQVVTLNTARVNDGIWHRVEITWFAIGSGGVRLSLDYDKRIVTRTLNAKVQGLYMGKVIVGDQDDDMVVDGRIKKLSPFNGCIVDIKIGSSQMLQKPAVISHVTEGCGSMNSCMGNKCPKNSDCVKVWEKYTCKCHSGFVGPACMPVCETNPCSNGAQCVEHKNSTRGYQCICNSQFYSGEYCEVEIDQTCPVSWWGHPVCGPCNCRTELGYNPDCNKTTGECSCEENHYQPKGSNRCLACDCYPTGSYDVSCNHETGQCHCRAGVIGRRCDSCPNPYAEITLRGCEVIYDGCPQNYASGVWWSRTKFGIISNEVCPRGSQGKASRMCDNELGMWRSPNVFNCTSDAFTDLKKLLTELENENMKMTTFLAIESASMIRKATNSSNTLYGADIFIAEKIIRNLLQYERIQSGLNLTHSQDKDYIQNIILGISRVINFSEYAHWQNIKKLSNETPELLLYDIWNYLITLVTNQHDTYTDPFEVVTSNLVVGLDVVTAESLFGYETEGIQIDSTLPDIFGLEKQQERVVIPNTTNILESGLEVSSLKIKSQVLGMKILTSPAVIFPKYNNYMMDESKFDMYSQIMIPIDILGIKSISQGELGSKMELEQSDNAVVGYVQYRSIGMLLPLMYDETVVKRWGINLTIGSPVISVIAATNRHYDGDIAQMPNTNLLNVTPLPSPVRIRMWLNTGRVSSQMNPQCVRWTSIRGFGEWTRAGCVTSLPDFEAYKKTSTSTFLVNCTCNQFSTYAVLIDLIEHEYVTEFTMMEDTLLWISYVLAISALLISCILLSVLRARTNSSSICINLVFCLLLTQCLYLFVLKSKVTIISNEFACKFSAIGLHYAWLTVMSWSLVSSLHLYRMLTEMRDVNHGQMAFYHTVGYGLPAVVVGLAVGVRADQYGNYIFCWLSLYESVVWSLIGPVCIMVVCNLVVLLLSLRAAFALKDHVAGYGNLRTLLWLNVVSLPLLVAVWMLELLTGTERDIILTFALALLVAVQAWFMLCGYCFGNARIRTSMSRIFLRASGRKVPPLPEEDIDSPLKTSTQSANQSGPRSALAYRNAGVNTFEVARRQIAISTSSTTSRSTGKTTSSPYRSDPHLRKNNTSTSSNGVEHSASDMAGYHQGQQASDSDSEGSVEHRSLDLASSHSSDEEDSARSQQRGHKKSVSISVASTVANVTIASTASPQVSLGYLPNVIQDSLPASRFPTIQPPPKHLNVISNSQLFPNVKSSIYAPRWHSSINNSSNIVEEDEQPFSHRWANAGVISDNNLVMAAAMNYGPQMVGIEDMYNMQDGNDIMEYEDNGAINYTEKYSFPYTAEEDHCSSPYLNMLRASEIPPKKLSIPDSPNFEFQRLNSNRTSVSSDVAQEFDYNSDKLRNSELNSRGTKSARNSIDRRTEYSGNRTHAVPRPYNTNEMARHDDINKGLEEASIRGYNIRRGSDMSVRSIRPTYEVPYGQGSRRNSDVDNKILPVSSLSLQRRVLYDSNEMPIADIAESEKDTNEETRV